MRDYVAMVNHNGRLFALTKMGALYEIIIRSDSFKVEFQFLGYLPNHE